MHEDEMARNPIQVFVSSSLSRQNLRPIITPKDVISGEKSVSQPFSVTVPERFETSPPYPPSPFPENRSCLLQQPNAKKKKKTLFLTDNETK
ncbi:hypothetical protein CEXT_800991 [Caerostris extrusa]|uniref:Uncharacterized protein n=1 Tax=Caerostris extrusa TaxID=172846 RepID=A0AAV4WLX6_CAEEX|nr:hypothetical protein CEXT_800991 [Caerostris extrusa]